MKEKLKTKPILVTGSHRSGTTWVGKMLSLAPGVVYIHEPLKIDSPRIIEKGLCKVKAKAGAKNWFTFVDEHNEDEFLSFYEEVIHIKWHDLIYFRESRSFRDIVRLYKWLRKNVVPLSKECQNRVLLKDPIAIFSAEWFARRLCAQIVILIRHPAAFASSLVRYGWHHPFSHFIEQPHLMKRLQQYESEVLEFSEQDRDIIDQAILLWKLIYATVINYQHSFQDWVYIRYEDVTVNSQSNFRELYERLGLRWSERIASEIMRNRNPNIDGWRQELTQEEVDRIKEGTKGIWQHFYVESDW